MGKRKKQLEQCTALAVEIAKLELKDGDSLVVKFPEEMDPENIETMVGRIDAMIQGMGLKVIGIILRGDVEFTVIRPEVSNENK